jgi:5'-3' exonuclease
MKSKDEGTNTTHLEAKQFAINMYHKMNYLIHRFRGAKIIMGLDSKEWRSAFMENHIKNHYKFYRNIHSALYYIDIGNHFIAIEKLAEKGWTKRALKTAEKKIMDVDDTENWVGFGQDGATPQWFIDHCGGTVFKNLYTECPEWEEIYALIKYKGQRRDKWESDFYTPFREFKDMARKLTYNLADHFGVPTVEAEWSEFDDIAHACVKANPEMTVVMATTDQDMDQEMLNGLFVSRFDCSNMTWVRKDQRIAEIHFLAKMLMGDTSDNIPPVTINDGKIMRFGEIKWDGPNTLDQELKKAKGKKNAKWLIKKYDELGLEGTHSFLVEHQMFDSYYLNYTMMHLGSAPAQVQENCKLALENLKVGEAKYTAVNFGVDENDPETLSKLIEDEQLGKRAASNDMAEGYTA